MTVIIGMLREPRGNFGRWIHVTPDPNYTFIVSQDFP